MNLLADLVLILHALVALFITGGFLTVWIGVWVRWRWTRNWMFRLLHLAAICFVALTSLIGLACPLTVLEDWLRKESHESRGFIQRWVGELLFYEFSAWIFTC